MLFSIVFDMSFISWINSAHLDKLTLKAGDGSGQTRYNLFIEGIKVFLQSPILGVGYGSHRTTSMLSSLLSNIGLVGTILFLLINYQIIKNIIKIIKRTDQFEVFILAYSLLLTLGTSLITYLIGKSMVAITFGWYWMLLAIMEVFYIKIYVKQTYEHSDNTGYIK
jgi:O-antigen ligase